MVRMQCKLESKVLEPTGVDSGNRKQLRLTTLCETVFPSSLNTGFPEKYIIKN